MSLSKLLDALRQRPSRVVPVCKVGFVVVRPAFSCPVSPVHLFPLTLLDAGQSVTGFWVLSLCCYHCCGDSQSHLNLPFHRGVPASPVARWKGLCYSTQCLCQCHHCLASTTPVWSPAPLTHCFDAAAVLRMLGPLQSPLP